MLKYWPVIFIIILLFGCKDFSSQKKIEWPEITGYWYEQPLRIQQTVLRQPDVIDYNVLLDTRFERSMTAGAFNTVSTEFDNAVLQDISQFASHPRLLVGTIRARRASN